MARSKEENAIIPASFTLHQRHVDFLEENRREWDGGKSGMVRDALDLLMGRFSGEESAANDLIRLLKKFDMTEEEMED